MILFFLVFFIVFCAVLTLIAIFQNALIIELEKEIQSQEVAIETLKAMYNKKSKKDLNSKKK